jgi:hypothetical protein
MLIPAFKRLLKTDYAQQFQQMIETLSYSINNAIESLNNALANNVTLQSNIACTVKTFTIQVDSTGKPTTTTTFPLTFKGTCAGLSVLNAINTTNSGSYPTGGVFVSFSQTQNGIQLNNVTGLEANNQYSITLVAWSASQ